MLNRVFLVITLILLTTACATGPAVPERLASPEDPFAMPIIDFLDEQRVLLSNLSQGYPRQLDEREWDRLNRISDNIVELVGEARTIEEIDMETRYTLFQLRTQLVATAVGGNADDIVCFKNRTTGTRVGPRRTCMTRAELDQKQFNAQFVMEYINAQPQGLNAQEF